MSEDSEPKLSHENVDPVAIDGESNPVPVLHGEALVRNHDYLAAAAEKGISISELLAKEWSQLEIETSEGRIILAREEVPGNELLRAKVLESEDPAMVAGQVIVGEGITMTGGSAMQGVIGPGARLAFRAQVVKNYKLGDTNSDETMTITPESVEEYAAHNGQIFVRTKEGMDLKYFDPTPRGTGFMNHAAIVNRENGELKSTYLF